MMQLDLAKNIFPLATLIYAVDIDRLASIVKFNFNLDPFQKNILFLFCGGRTDRVKRLVWEGDGSLLLYKRLDLGGFNWTGLCKNLLELLNGSTSN